MGAAEKLLPLDDTKPSRDVDGSEPPSGGQRRFARLLWKLYEHWEREQECATSEDSE